MWRAALVFLAATFPLQGQAGSLCKDGKNDAIEVLAWTARDDKTSTYLEVLLKSTLEKDVKMIDASIEFYDVLGGRIGAMGIDRDLHLPHDTEVQLKGSRLGLTRLTKLEKADVQTEACVRSVLYTDGEIQRFN